MSSSAMIEKLSNAIGFCGKIPSKGDFLHSELPQDFTEVWNEWLQSIIGVSREQLGERWLEEYLISPVWNFALSAGASGHQKMSGVLIPSVDRVGRYFPFTVAHVSQSSPASVALGKMEWFEQLNLLALEALDSNDFNFTDYQQALNDLLRENHQQKDEYVVSGKTHVGRKTSWQFQQAAEKNQIGNMAELLHVSWKKIFGCYTVWWTNGSETIAPSLLVCDGLPEVGRFAAMLDGNWEQWGWQSHQVMNG